MSCILRISGESLDVEAMLSQKSLAPDQTWVRGKGRSAGGSVHSDSGANFVASNANLDEFELQLAQATAYLELHAAEVATMAATPGVDFAVLDFGVAPSEDSFVEYCYFPPKFVRLLASVGVGLEVSQYACSRDSSEG